ncbi:IclR family transcriptional regulator [uncultured Citricoccus sp.]|uniref:IclR family transcriptional regulator n=1 Tax=uncultured Citricoccus sp. TaxID=614031 RepID=UPI002606DAF6|nr:IclR family transcriptional regulator [uncultured Citricoccus sp.]
MPAFTDAPGLPRSVVARALLILGQFSVAAPALTISEISRSTGLPVATVFRLLGELEAGDFVERSSGGRYRLGKRLWEMGLLTPLHGRVRETALPFLLNLQYKTRQTVQFAIPDDLTALYIEKLTDEESVPLQSRIGARIPLHATGLGKAILAFSDTPTQDHILTAPLAQFTPQTQTNPDQLTCELHAIREQGYATSAEEYLPGSTSIAAPVLVDGIVQAGVGLVNYQLDPNLERFTEPLLHAAQGISQRLQELGEQDFPSLHA